MATSLLSSKSHIQDEPFYFKAIVVLRYDISILHSRYLNTVVKTFAVMLLHTLFTKLHENKLISTFCKQLNLFTKSLNGKLNNQQ